jgi:hypothetical protein
MELAEVIAPSEADCEQAEPTPAIQGLASIDDMPPEVTTYVAAAFRRARARRLAGALAP